MSDQPAARLPDGASDGVVAPGGEGRPTRLPARERAAVWREIGAVLGVSLGASALWSLLAIVDKLTRAVALNAQTTTMNNSVTPDRPWLDLAYQLTGIGLAVVPAGLAIYLLGQVRPAWATGTGRGVDTAPVDGGAARATLGDLVGGAAYRLGFDRRDPGRDLWRGALLAALVGLPGLGFYLLARGLGINTTIAAANLAAAWWTVPVLVLSAVGNAVLEEVVVVGYLYARLGQVGWGMPATMAASAVLRGAYHLYQGFGGFLGNVVMGLVFGAAYRRWGRVMPLVVAHTLLDVVAFVGYSLLRGHVGWL